jgi:hypothetical protein
LTLPNARNQIQAATGFDEVMVAKTNTIQEKNRLDKSWARDQSTSDVSSGLPKRSLARERQFLDLGLQLRGESRELRMSSTQVACSL